VLHELDLALFRAINTGFSTAPFDGLARALQHPWWLWAPLVGWALWLLWRGDRHTRLFVIGAVVAVVVTDVFCAQVLKPLVGRMRPTIALEGVRMVLGRKSGFSFPSNHAANMAAAAVWFSLRYRRWWPAWVTVALIVGVSRIYAGVHYPADVLGGFAVGAAVAVATAWVFEMIEQQFERGDTAQSGNESSK
jgi:undecaprenyl-diphosphatase